jgi:hemerythrin-like domain-containing protein
MKDFLGFYSPECIKNFSKKHNMKEEDVLFSLIESTIKGNDINNFRFIMPEFKPHENVRKYLK